ncbi:hypothetical protein LPB140_09705 [Sphingorhabdus lutea]|uniref:Major facilitator superfamily (MFS) profile domain-containing protein n=2 Tax=Sphingorhabdus lutea TaxID=1913578 RepID=A0A1L3JD04_9SPHN|nr:hypothetical protein LPB140_09705 [Sphingorhabdus lutea]
MNKPETENKNKLARLFILLTVFIYSMGFGIIMPALPQLIIELENISLSEATFHAAWLGAAYAIAQFLMGPLMGNLGDRFGRRPIFLFSLFGFGIDFLLMGLAPNIIWLFIGRAIAGGLGAIFGPANAAMADISSDKDRAKSFGLIGAAFGIGFIMGPAMGGFLADWGTRIPFFVAGALALANAIFGYFIFPETMKQGDKRDFDWKRSNPLGALISLSKTPSLLPIAAVYFLWLTATNVYPASWAFFAIAQFGWDSKTIGLSLTMVGASMALVQGFVIGPMVAKFGERRTAQYGMCFAGLSFITLAFMQNGNIALALCGLMGLQGIIMPSISAMMSQRTPSSAQGELQGFNGSLSALSFLLAQLVYNGSLSYFTSANAPIKFAGAPFILALFFTISAFVTLYFVAKNKKHISY